MRAPTIPADAIKMSPSKLSLINPDLDPCERCFWLTHKHEVKRPSGIFPSLPSGIDKQLKAYYGRYREHIVPEIKGKLQGKLYGHIAQLAVWQNNFKGLQLYIPKLNMVFKGAIDDVLLNDKKQFSPIDFKTRGYPLKAGSPDYYRLQLDSYNLLFKYNGYEITENAYLVYYWPECVNAAATEASGVMHMKFITHIQEYKGLDGSFALSVLKRAREIINMERPPASHPTCEYCIGANKHVETVRECMRKPEKPTQKSFQFN
ncbi:PD-(D/E)XK nuclease family protein [bacterium]|nr:PD-(D/E)XK nuclease family protein [bacterium]